MTPGQYSIGGSKFYLTGVHRPLHTFGDAIKRVMKITNKKVEDATDIMFRKPDRPFYKYDSSVNIKDLSLLHHVTQYQCAAQNAITHA